MKDRVHKTEMSPSEGKTYICIHGANISVRDQWTLFL